MIEVMPPRPGPTDSGIAQLAVDAQLDLATGPPKPVIDGPLLRLALGLIVGIILGRYTQAAGLWLALAAGSSAVMGGLLWRRHAAWAAWAGAVGLVALGAAWYGLRAEHVSSHDISRWIGPEPALVELEGQVVSAPRPTARAQGPFAAFDHRLPSLLFDLEVTGITRGDHVQPASGRLQGKLREMDHRLHQGDRIRAIGWLNAFTGARNPGTFDYRAMLAQRQIHGQLTLASRGSWQPIESAAPWGHRLLMLRQRIARKAHESLAMGMDHDSRGLSLLETMLLGVWKPTAQNTAQAFRKVGLAHLLSISGAHLAILLGLVWILAKGLVDHPPRAATIVLIVLLFYLLAVPLRVPVVRAVVMAGLFAVCYASGRRVRATELLALAAILILLWRPMDLFTAGFQLSFGVVSALLLFVPRVSHGLWPGSMLVTGSRRSAIARWGVDYLAVSVVAFVVALPCVAYHFQLVSPLAVLLGVLAWPMVAMVLAVGYFKILMGLAFPSVSWALAGLAQGLSNLMLGLVDWAATWPGASVELAQRPTVGWTLGATAVMVALLMGRFARRGKALVACLLLVGAWGWWTTAGVQQPSIARGGLALNMLAVGDGSCFVIRFDDGQTMMFDCGSQSYANIGATAVVPVLRQMGIDHLDLLVLSHADLDHYNGSLDVVDAFNVQRVWMPWQFLDEAQEAAAQGQYRAARHLVESLHDRGVLIETVHAGRQETWGSAQLQVLWPPDDQPMTRANDTSIVLSVKVADRRILLNGDLQQESISRLLESGIDLRAHITDLPHHGSFVRASPAWLDAVEPQVVLQSSARWRLRQDRWRDLLQASAIQRYVSDTSGMVELRIGRDGSLTTWRFLEADPPHQPMP